MTMRLKRLWRACIDGGCCWTTDDGRQCYHREGRCRDHPAAIIAIVLQPAGNHPYWWSADSPTCTGECGDRVRDAKTDDNRFTGTPAPGAQGTVVNTSLTGYSPVMVQNTGQGGLYVCTHLDALANEYLNFAIDKAKNMEDGWHLLPTNPETGLPSFATFLQSGLMTFQSGLWPAL